jgi:radial spoke head protein 9
VESEDFTGIPSRIIKNFNGNSSSEEMDQDEIQNPQNEESNMDDVTHAEEEIDLGNSKTSKLLKKKQNITELEKLAFVVRAIENECAVVPVGSVKIMPNHQLR